MICRTNNPANLRRRRDGILGSGTADPLTRLPSRSRPLRPLSATPLPDQPPRGPAEKPQSHPGSDGKHQPFNYVCHRFIGSPIGARQVPPRPGPYDQPVHSHPEQDQDEQREDRQCSHPDAVKRNPTPVFQSALGLRLRGRRSSRNPRLALDCTGVATSGR
jgi:hypothetical protein